MTKEEYLKQLERYLKKLPQKDYENAVDHFTEYFEEAGPENEAAVMKELGEPKEAAAELLKNLLTEKTEAQADKKGGISPHTAIAIAIPAVLAAPIGLPLICAGIAVIIIGVLLMVSIFITALWFDVRLLFESLKLILIGISTLPISPSGACIFAGTGIFGTGSCILLSIMVVYICKCIITGLLRFTRCIINKRRF